MVVLYCLPNIIIIGPIPATSSVTSLPTDNYSSGKLYILLLLFNISFIYLVLSDGVIAGITIGIVILVVLIIIVILTIVVILIYKGQYYIV